MKFSDISAEQWEELTPYLDTCLLPVTGMTGLEKPYEATKCLEQLRDMMDLIEIPFKGRVITYPACHYISESNTFEEILLEWCTAIKKSGFRYLIVVSANNNLKLSNSAIDLTFLPSEDGVLPLQDDLSQAIRHMWNGQNT